MGQYLSWQGTDLKFGSDVTQEQIQAAVAAVMAVGEKARSDGDANVQLVDRGEGRVIAIEYLHGWNADLADALREQAHLFQDTGERHGTCEEGDGHFFWRIKGGVYQDCGVLFEPDGQWAPAQPDDEQQLCYLQSQGVRCPACNSDDIEGGPVDIVGSAALQSVHCLACGARWQDLYRLEGFTDLLPSE